MFEPKVVEIMGCIFLASIIVAFFAFWCSFRCGKDHKLSELWEIERELREERERQLDAVLSEIHKAFPDRQCIYEGAAQAVKALAGDSRQLDCAFMMEARRTLQSIRRANGWDRAILDINRAIRLLDYGVHLEIPREYKQVVENGGK